MQKYSFKCPACGAVMTVDAESNDEAVNKIMDKGAEHMKEVHPGMPADPNMANMIREQMQNGESAHEEQHSITCSKCGFKAKTSDEKEDHNKKHMGSQSM